MQKIRCQIVEGFGSVFVGDVEEFNRDSICYLLVVCIVRSKPSTSGWRVRATASGLKWYRVDAGYEKAPRFPALVNHYTLTLNAKDHG